MRFANFAALLALATPLTCGAIVIRDDVADAQHLASPEDFPALVDLPGDGHGVLIAPQWVLTAAHAVEFLGHGATVMIAGEAHEVVKTILHPGYKSLPQELTVGDAAPVIAFARSRHDIALLHLAKPVIGVAPIKLNKNKDEVGKMVTFFGKGRTGNGLTGQDQSLPTRGALRRAQNVITVAEGHWIGYRFDKPDSALPLEGILGNGDSGGPVLVKERGEWVVLGINAFMDGHGDLATTRFATYGTTGYQARISSYIEWIKSTIKSAK